jgi:hypothetical protein
MLRVDSRRTIPAHPDRSVNRTAVLENRESCVDKPLTAAHVRMQSEAAAIDIAQKAIG